MRPRGRPAQDEEAWDRNSGDIVISVHAVSLVDVPSNNSKWRGPYDAGHCAVSRKASVHYQFDGS